MSGPPCYFILHRKAHRTTPLLSSRRSGDSCLVSLSLRAPPHRRRGRGKERIGGSSVATDVIHSSGSHSAVAGSDLQPFRQPPPAHPLCAKHTTLLPISPHHATVRWANGCLAHTRPPRGRTTGGTRAERKVGGTGGSGHPARQERRPLSGTPDNARHSNRQPHLHSKRGTAPPCRCTRHDTMATERPFVAVQWQSERGKAATAAATAARRRVTPCTQTPS